MLLYLVSNEGGLLKEMLPPTQNDRNVQKHRHKVLQRVLSILC